jgi:hypothetical protein
MAADFFDPKIQNFGCFLKENGSRRWLIPAFFVKSVLKTPKNAHSYVIAHG